MEDTHPTQWINKNVAQLFWSYIETQKAMGQKEALQIYNWLNHDNLEAIIFDRGVFWIELTWSKATLPKYTIDYIKKWAKLYDYKYLYDLKIK